MKVERSHIWCENCGAVRELIFEGAPPFELPIAQPASAETTDTTVQLTFRVLDDHTGKLVLVRIRLAHAVASDLAGHIAKEAAAARQNAQRA